jgi:hypothetical protein
VAHVPKEIDAVWIAWGVCINPKCSAHYVGDMTWRRDDEMNEYAVCPVCDVEIADTEMPKNRGEREQTLGF